MNITREADYAIRVIANLSLTEEGERVSASTLAEEETIPQQFLLKILRKLRKQGLIKSYMGVKGGYILNKKPGDITFKDVIEAIDGPIYINACLYDRTECNRYPINCIVHKKLKVVQQGLVEDLESINFKNLFEEADPNPVPDCLDLDKILNA